MTSRISDEERYKRLEMIVGQEAVQKLKRSKVLIFGLGGVGGSCVEALVRSGIRKITIIDGDQVDVTNLNRQLIALESTIGERKTQAMADRLMAIDSSVQVEKIDSFILPEDDWSIEISDFDFVVDAIDTVASKVEIARRCKQAGIPLIAAMGFGNKLDPTQIEIAKLSETSICPLAKAYRKKLRQEGIIDVAVAFSKEVPAISSRPPGSTAFVPAAAGLCMAAYVVREIIGQ